MVAGDNDIVIIDAVRTPITRARRGPLRGAYPDELLAQVVDGLMMRNPGVDPAMIGDMCVGNVLSQGNGIFARTAQALSRTVPFTVPVSQTNRQCSSGLEAVLRCAGSIAMGSTDACLAAGVESMSRGDMAASATGGMNPAVKEHSVARTLLTPMGITSENVAERYGVTRADQDAFAAESHARAARAWDRDLFRDEVIPVTVAVPAAAAKGAAPTPAADEHPRGARGKEAATMVVDKDDGVRRGVTVESLGKLRPAFRKGGSTTAGNASQVSDGAAAVLLMRGSVARRLGLAPLARLVSHAVVGVDPEVMGIGPAVAIPRAAELAGISVSDLGAVELNEAFASQAVYCVRKLGLDPSVVNPLGGAIALGHPLGCTGARQIATLVHHMRREGIRYGCVSMCIGTGMGMAAIFEAPVGDSRARL